ncbi:MAG: hypothetical protein ACOC6G_04285, partial [Thermoproteota archaeon]
MENLERAEKQSYFFTKTDLSSKISYRSMALGVAKIQCFLDEVEGNPEDVVVVFGPDGCFTRNYERFRNGVGYGCAVSTEKYMFPKLLRPNACGFLLIHLTEEVALREILKAHKKLKTEGVMVNGKRDKWDIYKSNHFVDLIRLETVEHPYTEEFEWLKPGEKFVLLHSSPQGYKEDLYNFRSEEMIKVETSLGPVEALSGKGASEYIELFKEAEKISKDKRVVIAESLFGEENIETVCNPTHQGYFKEDSRFVMRLGTHNSQDTSSPTGKPIFPIAFNAYSKFFLYEGRPNIKYDFWTEKQRERAEELGHKKIIENINILPHGGGYALNLPYSDVDYTILNGEIYYKLFNPLME